MPGCIVIGAQWGDEGKGKIVDILTAEASHVVRFQGGNNAGHTLVVDSGSGPVKTVLHLIPSGILHDDKVCVIASGVVVDPVVLLQEVQGLADGGLEVADDALLISRDAHVIMPYHCAVDIAREERRAGSKIGTTGRGIGPAYEDRAARRGVRISDLLDRDALRERLEQVVPERNVALEWFGVAPFDIDTLTDEYLAIGDKLRRWVGDCRQTLADARRSGAAILYEGAQGTLLDIGHGTYPFVTSSHTTAGGACTGAGVPPMSIDAVLGIAKAYATRVGSGPFPTELFDADGEALRAAGHEFGATTGRPRRCGWFDAPVMRYAVMVNGFTSLAITKLDVLTGMDELKICVAHDVDGQRLDVCRPDAAAMERAVPVYESMPGWTEDITGCQSVDELPANARAFVDRLSELSGCPVGIISVGPGRRQTIVLNSPFAGS